MPGFNGNGVFVRTYSWAQDAASGINIRSDRMDTEDNGFATGLSNCVTKDGQTTVTANLPMANFRHTFVGNASARNDYAAAGQVQDSAITTLGSVSGTNTITAAIAAPLLQAYVAGQMFGFKATGTNTGAVTLNINAIGAVAIQKLGQALVAGDITIGDIVHIGYDGAAFQMLSPARGIVAGNGSIAPGKLAAQANNTIISNISGASASPSANTISSVLDNFSALQGAILFRGSVGWSALPPGSSGQALKTQGAGADPIWAAAGAVSGYYDSGPQAITASGSLTLPHSLGAQPRITQSYITCVTAQAGYSPGDVIEFNGSFTIGANAGSNFGAAIIPDSTNLNIRFAAGSGGVVYIVPNKANGAQSNLTNANWTVGFRAFA